MTRLKTSGPARTPRGPAAAARAAARGLALGWLPAAAALALSGCAGGAIGANTPLSGGPNFVSSSYDSKYFSPGSRPVAPDVRGTLLTGQKFSLSADRGEVVVLNFWGSWCSPCRREAPALAALSQHYKNSHVAFVGDNVLDYPASAKAFERQFNISYPSLNDQGEQVVLAFHSTVPPNAIPSTLIIDKTGRIAARVVGEVSYHGLRALIDKVLAAKA